MGSLGVVAIGLLILLLCGGIIVGGFLIKGIKGDESMRAEFNLRNIYLYLVCFVTLIMIIVGSVRLIETVVDFVYPAPSYYPIEKLPGMTGEDAELAKERALLEQDREERRMIHDRARNLAGAVALLVVALPTYLYHWRRIQGDVRT